MALPGFGIVLLAVVGYAGWSANRAAVMRERQLVEKTRSTRPSAKCLDQLKAIAWVG